MPQHHALLDDRSGTGPGFVTVLLLAFATLVMIGLVAGVATVGAS